MVSLRENSWNRFNGAIAGLGRLRKKKKIFNPWVCMFGFDILTHFLDDAPSRKVRKVVRELGFVISLNFAVEVLQHFQELSSV